MTDAARELRFSPAAVSQQMSALERQVGAPLFVRHARGVRPTAAGLVLARHAKELVDRLADAERELDSLLSASAGVVRVGIFASAIVGALPAALAAFRQSHPAVNVTISECDVDVGVERLRSGELDLAIVFDEPDQPTLDRSRLDLTPIGIDPIDIALREDHPLAQALEVDLDALSQEPWILARGARCAALVRRTCQAAGFEPRVLLTVDDHAAACSLTASGIGVAALPRLMGRRSGDGVAVRALRPSPIRAVYAAVPEDTSGLPAALALRDAFVATVRLPGLTEPQIGASDDVNL
jgi:DNA-binding transcriptional LysR family regulator